MKLTPQQLAFLKRALRDTYSDGSGYGVKPHGGHEVRTAMSLHRKGLVTIPAAWTAYAGCRITPAGRLALQENRHD